MKIISTGNNFGHAGGVEFNAFLSENAIVLNGRFSVDTASEEYRSAEVLEVYLPQLPMERSAVADGWCFLHLYFSTSGDLFRQDIRAQLERFLDDASADVFLVGGGQQSGLKGAYIAEGHIGDGILTVTKASASMGDTGEYPFLFAFIVRDSVDASEVAPEGEGNLDNQ